MDHMLSLPVPDYHFGTQERGHSGGAQPSSYPADGRSGEYFRGDGAHNTNGRQLYSIHEQPNVGTSGAHQQPAGSSYHHEHLLSNTGATSADYGPPATSSLSTLATYSGLAPAPLPTPSGAAVPYSSAPSTYTLSHGYAQPFNAPSAMRIPSVADQQTPSEVVTSGRSYGLANPISPSSHELSRRSHYTTSIPDHRNSRLQSPRQRRHEVGIPKTPSYNLVDQTPRTVYSPMSISSPQATIYSGTYGTGVTPTEASTNVPPFADQSNLCELWGGLDNLHKPVVSAISCKIEKGFFQSPSDGCYTCYRRNYFSVSCEYSLSPLLPEEPLYLTRESKTYQVQALAMCLSAAVDGPNGKKIDLVQYTPKRDHGEKTDVTKRKVLPTTPAAQAGHGEVYPFGYHHGAIPYHRGPLLPLQQLGSETERAQLAGQTSASGCTATFERVQFKSATANNGKRRAQQQYYHITVELWADIRQSPKDPELWAKVAQRTSEPVVVRGRSPSHYKNEGTSGSGDFRGGGAPGGSSGGLGNYTYTTANPGSGREYGISSAGGPHGGVGASYRLSSAIEQQSIDVSPTSSTSSVTTGPPDNMPLASGITLGQSQFGQPLHRSNTYEYFPAPLATGYDSSYARADSAYGRSDSDLTRPIKTDPYGGALGNADASTATCSQYAKPALPTSRGYYSRVANGY